MKRKAKIGEYEFDLSVAAIKRWVKSKAPDEIVGICDHTGKCLIAQYLRHTTGAGYVSVDGETAVVAARKPRTVLAQLTAPGVALDDFGVGHLVPAFDDLGVERVDDWLQEHAPDYDRTPPADLNRVTAAEVLAAGIL